MVEVVDATCGRYGSESDYNPTKKELRDIKNMKLPTVKVVHFKNVVNFTMKIIMLRSRGITTKEPMN
jgi:hypothetical protein